MAVSENALDGNADNLEYRAHLVKPEKDFSNRRQDRNETRHEYYCAGAYRLDNGQNRAQDCRNFRKQRLDVLCSTAENLLYNRHQFLAVVLDKALHALEQVNENREQFLRNGNLERVYGLKNVLQGIVESFRILCPLFGIPATVRLEICNKFLDAFIALRKQFRHLQAALAEKFLRNKCLLLRRS